MDIYFLLFEVTVTFDSDVSSFETNYCEATEMNFSITNNFGSYVNCIKAYCYYDRYTEVDYICIDIGTVKFNRLVQSNYIMDLKEYGNSKIIKTVNKTIVIPLFE